MLSRNAGFDQSADEVRTRPPVEEEEEDCISWGGKKKRACDCASVLV